MDIVTLHQFLGRLIEAGVSPTIPVVAISQNLPNEISEVCLLSGDYFGDPSPKLSAFASRSGHMLALIPVTLDTSGLVNPNEVTGVASHVGIYMPVELPEPQ